MIGKKKGNMREMKKMRNLIQIFDGYRILCVIYGNVVKVNINLLSVESNFKGFLYFMRFFCFESMQYVSEIVVVIVKSNI